MTAHDNGAPVKWWHPIRFTRAVRHNVRVRNFAQDVGMDVLQRIADGASHVDVDLVGERSDGRFKDTDIRVSSERYRTVFCGPDCGCTGPCEHWDEPVQPPDSETS